jgi:L-lysine exporter family protein LysE/ArgO
MVSAFFTGFFLGLSLIVAIGSQNAFVLRQGILRQHIFYIALFCAISDSLLIIAGILGISYFLNDFINEFSKIIFGFSAIWLFSYGALRLHSAFKAKSTAITNNSEPSSLFNAISIVGVFTFLNPHVYLDTMILIGSISQQFMELNRIYFAIGACTASFVWFFSIAYGAKLLTPIMQKHSHWKIFDSLLALIMFIIAFNLASQGGWF